jgi:hypothetical protein
MGPKQWSSNQQNSLPQQIDTKSATHTTNNNTYIQIRVLCVYLFPLSYGVIFSEIQQEEVLAVYDKIIGVTVGAEENVSSTKFLKNVIYIPLPVNISSNYCFIHRNINTSMLVISTNAVYHFEAV